MRLVSLGARALALVLIVASMSLAFAADVTSGPAAPDPSASARQRAIGPGSPGTVASTGAATLAADPARAQARAAAKQRASQAAAERQRRAIAAKKARAHRLAQARRAARARAAKRRWARLPKTKRLGFRWPAQGWITSGFGPRRSGMHHGMDIACRKGSFIRASRGGRVIFSKKLTVYGNTVVIRHPGGYTTLYGHMNRVYARAGRVVRTRQVIGRCGSTGRSTGPHLHFELRRNGRYLKPGHYLL